LKDPFELEARYYDKIWGSTCDYSKEAGFLHQIFKDYRVRKVLDMACGIGGHSVELAKLGYRVLGVDVSQKMLELARAKATKAGVGVRFIYGDMTHLSSVLSEENVAFPFDAVLCMGNSLAHLLDEESFRKTLDEISKVLCNGGVLVFWVKNAKLIRDDLINRLMVDSLINEPDLSLALLCYTFRDKADPDILIWNSIYLIKDHGNLDFQVRTHPLKWFRHEKLAEILKSQRFKVIHTYGDTSGQKTFEEEKHDTIFLVCQRKG